MALDENNPESAAAKPVGSGDFEAKKGQMLVIYLPEGSVIVDRTDMVPTAVPKELVHQVAEVPPVVQAAEPPKEETPTMPELGLQDIVRMTVLEVLQETGTAKKQLSAVPGIAPSPVAPEDSQKESAVSPALAPQRMEAAAKAPTQRRLHHGHPRRRRKLNWVHGINTMVICYIVIASILPAVLSSGFGLAIYSSKNAHPGVAISRGDLLVCNELPAANLKVNDVLLVRDGNTWTLDARQVTANTSDGRLSTVATASTSGIANDRTYVMPNASTSYKVSRIIPKLGYVPMVLSSTITKVVGGLFILILNLTVHYRNVRRRREEIALR